MSSTSYHLAELRRGLKPFRLYWFPRLRSTNDHAAELRKRGDLFAPAVVLTGRQTAGRGRGKNTWWSAGGVITATFVLPIDEQRQPQQLPLLAGLAVRDAIEELSGCRVQGSGVGVQGSGFRVHDSEGIQLKWPNDVLWNGRKIAGLLCERIHKADLVGVGLNVAVPPRAVPRKLRPGIAALSDITRNPPSMSGMLIALADHLKSMLQQSKSHPYVKLLRQYDTHHALVGRPVQVDDGFGQVVRGRCEGIDDFGRLLVRQGPQLHRLLQGHVDWQK